MNTRELGSLIESFAPLSLQESWDNSGYNVDLQNENVGRVMLCLDVSPEVVAEAADQGCGVIISHHPLLFHGIKAVRSSSAVGRCLSMLCEKGISLYCSHTPMDSSNEGINAELATMLGLGDPRPLAPAGRSRMYKLAVTVPPSHGEAVWRALTQSGAGRLDGYADCTFTVAGTGTYRALPGSTPFIGKEWSLEKVDELRIEVLVMPSDVPDAVKSVQAAHPYEMPAIDLYEMEDARFASAGMGRIGDLEEAMTLSAFAELCAEKLDCKGRVRVRGDLGASVQRIAVCGGAGSDLCDAARAMGADVLLTGEVKHSFYGESPIALVDAGHYDTEKCFLPAMRRALLSRGLEERHGVGVSVSGHAQRPYTIM